MGIKLSTKRRRGRSYSFTEKDRKPNPEVANSDAAKSGKESKKSKRSVSSAAKFSSSARETYVAKVCFGCKYSVKQTQTLNAMFSDWMQ